MRELDFVPKPSPQAKRRLIVGGVSVAAAAVAGLMIALPAFAHDNPSPTPCGTTLPTASCSPTVTAPGTTAGNYVVSLPGIGTLTVTLDNTGKVTGASEALLTTFTATSTKIDGDGDKVTVVITGPNPNVLYRVTVKVKQSETGTTTVTAKLKPVQKEMDEDTNENEQEGADTDTGDSGQNSQGQNSDGQGD